MIGQNALHQIDVDQRRHFTEGQYPAFDPRVGFVIHDIGIPETH